LLLQSRGIDASGAPNRPPAISQPGDRRRQVFDGLHPADGRVEFVVAGGAAPLPHQVPNGSQCHAAASFWPAASVFDRSNRTSLLSLRWIGGESHGTQRK